MGNFIDMAAVLASKEKVAEYLATTGDDGAADCISDALDRTLVLFAEATGEFARIQNLSRDLKVPTFALHIHDDDLWLYEFYKDGEAIDQFNPIPGYWEEVSAQEKARWAGRADVIAANWPGVSKEDIELYFVQHDTPGFDEEKKAYPSDGGCPSNR
jgi:hypothetical protein